MTNVGGQILRIKEKLSNNEENRLLLEGTVFSAVFPSTGICFVISIPNTKLIYSMASSFSCWFWGFLFILSFWSANLHFVGFVWVLENYQLRESTLSLLIIFCFFSFSIFLAVSICINIRYVSANNFFGFKICGSVLQFECSREMLPEKRELKNENFPN